PAQGTILQHPLMDERREAGIKVEGEKYQIESELMQRLLVGGDVDYRDPLSDASDGSAYQGPWIAAMQPVAVPHEEPEEDHAIADQASSNRDPPPPPADLSADSISESNEKATDLLVLVQYRLEKVIAPVHQMRTALLWEGAAAIASILAVTLTLWFFVRRVGSSRSRKIKSVAPTATPAETMTMR
ncbi:MAG: serine/threonine protein kinase, partial [Rubripirellula sp.]